MSFEPERFVGECRVAAGTADPASAIIEVVAAAVLDGGAIDDALGRETKREPDTLFSSPDLTVQRILWPPGLSSLPHEHRMTAVIGVYAGEEINRLYHRSSGGLEERERRVLSEKEVLVLDADAVHSVENPLRAASTAGIHVYCGDILRVERSAWGPDGLEVPFADNTTAMRAMFQVMLDVAAEDGIDLDDETRYRANMAFRTWYERERRYPTATEARLIVTTSWNHSP